MPITVCNICQERVLTSITNTDVVHECVDATQTLAEEDVVQIGTWTDYTGSGGTKGYNIFYQGVQNLDFGTDAWLRGVNEDPRTDRGARSSTHRTRRRLVFVDFNKVCKR